MADDIYPTLKSLRTVMKMAHTVLGVCILCVLLSTE